MKDRLLAWRPWIIRLVGYPLFFMFFFVTFLYATFPYDRLKDVIIAQIEAPRVSPSGRSTPSNMEVTIASLGPTFFPGLKARDVRVTYLPTAQGQRPTFMRLDEVAVHVSLLALMTKNANIDFDIEGAGGEIEGDASYYFGTEPAPGVRSLEVELKNVNAGELGPLVQAVGLPMGGTLTGKIALNMPEGQVAQAEGSVQINAARLTLGDGRAQYQIPHFGGVTIEQIRAGDLAVNVNVRRGVATFERTGCTSPEFALQIDGRVDLRPNLGDSAMNLGIRFRLTDTYRNKSEQAGRILTVLDMVPDLQRARRPDGMIGLRCTGTFARSPVCMPDQRAAGVAGAPM
jgi:type II secretion system protein N